MGLRDKGQLLQTVKALHKMNVTALVISIGWSLYHICTVINEEAVVCWRIAASPGRTVEDFIERD
jgi:hypothetical protein